MAHTAVQSADIGPVERAQFGAAFGLATVLVAAGVVVTLGTGRAPGSVAALMLGGAKVGELEGTPPAGTASVSANGATVAVGTAEGRPYP